ncbi:MAG: STAS-like domain-containing protein [Planctomycetes bacterium]|nr:STAS-like domain-containing protein [Planctomycetota bacterium]
MRIEIKKFGDILTSRPAGKEAYLSARAYILPKESDEEIILDFEGVKVLSPSWGDECISKVMEEYPGKTSFDHTENPSVQATLDILKRSSSK